MTSMEKDGRKAVSAREAARRLGYSGPRWIYCLIDDGRLEAFRTSPRKTWVYVDSIERLKKSASNGIF